MPDNCTKEFQQAVDKYLIRHRSVVDVMTKYQEATARVNRALAKSVTECGCIKVTASRQQFPPETTYSDLQQFMSTHIEGELCPICKDVLTKEIGHNLFYLAGLCSLSGLSMDEVMEAELKNVTTLGVYHLS